jgi:hypothetical protein
VFVAVGELVTKPFSKEGCTPLAEVVVAGTAAAAAPAAASAVVSAGASDVAASAAATATSSATAVTSPAIATRVVCVLDDIHLHVIGTLPVRINLNIQ